jgi:hypothetical protein
LIILSVVVLISILESSSFCGSISKFCFIVFLGNSSKENQNLSWSCGKIFSLQSLLLWYFYGRLFVCDTFKFVKISNWYKMTVETDIFSKPFQLMWPVIICENKTLEGTAMHEIKKILCFCFLILGTWDCHCWYTGDC